MAIQALGDPENSSEDPKQPFHRAPHSHFLIFNPSLKPEAFLLPGSVPMYLGQHVRTHSVLSSPRALSLPAQDWFHGQHTFPYRKESQSKDTQGKDNVISSVNGNAISAAGVGLPITLGDSGARGRSRTGSVCKQPAPASI